MISIHKVNAVTKMETLRIIQEELRRHSSINRELSLSDESTEFIVKIVDNIINIFGDEPEKVSGVMLQTILERHISPSPSEEWSLSNLFDALSTDTPILSLKQCLVKRLISAMLKLSTWSSEYYAVIHSIYKYDNILKRLWNSYLPPTPLLDIKAMPDETKISSIVVTDAGKLFYTELTSSMKYTNLNVESAIINAARWIALLGTKLNREDHESYVKFIPSKFISENLTECIFLRTLNIIFAELWKRIKEGAVVHYSDVVIACKENSFWVHLSEYLEKERLLTIEDSSPEEIPFDELFISHPSSPSNDNIEIVSSPSNNFKPAFDDVISPSKSQIEDMKVNTVVELRQMQGDVKLFEDEFIYQN